MHGFVHGFVRGFVTMMEMIPQNCVAFELVLANALALGCIFVPKTLYRNCIWCDLWLKMGSLGGHGLGGWHGLGGVPFCFAWHSLKMDLAWSDYYNMRTSF